MRNNALVNLIKGSYFLNLRMIKMPIKVTINLRSLLYLRLSEAYHNSQTGKQIDLFWEGTKINFRYSFLGKIDNINERINIIFKDSQVMKYPMIKFERTKHKIINSAYDIKTSGVYKFKDALKRNFSISPLKVAGVIVVSAILVEIILSMLFNKKIDLIGWSTRFIFLFLGFASLFSDTSWDDIRETSFIIEYIHSLSPSG